MSDDTPTVGEIASEVSSSDVDLTTIITAGSEAAGAAEAVASAEKFKMHKDNPTQIPIGKK
jgi:intracellular multiplication protein IcmD